MRHTQILALVSLLLALGLTACGGDSRNSSAGSDGVISGDSAGTQNGVSGSAGTNDSTGANSNIGTNGSTGTNGNAGTNGDGIMPDDSLVDDARNALDDAGNAVGRAMGGY